MPDPQTAIARALGGLLVPGRRYPRPLPPELERWYCYTADGGHSIAVVLAQHYREDAADLTDQLVPAPVRSVLRAGYTIRRGYVVCDLPYDPDLGLTTPPEDDEY